MNPRTVGALALCPTGNVQGSFYFMSISTGWVLNRLHGMALPMPDNVVDRIHRLAQQQKTNPRLLFGDRNMNSVDMDNKELSDDEDNEDYVPDEEEYDEGTNDEDDYIIRNYDDDEIIQDEEDDYEPVGNDTTDVNNDNNLGHLIGSPGEVMPDENPGVEDNENVGVEQEDHDIISPEVEDVKSTEVEDDNVTENQDSVSIENEKNETVRNDQDCTENEGVQNESRYNLQRNHA